MQAYFCKEICSSTCGDHLEAELQKHQHHKDTIFFSCLQHGRLFWNSYASWELQGGDSRRVVQMPGKRENCILLLSWNGRGQGERLGNDLKEYIPISFPRESTDCSHHRYLQYFENMYKMRLLNDDCWIPWSSCTLCRDLQIWNKLSIKINDWLSN